MPVVLKFLVNFQQRDCLLQGDFSKSLFSSLWDGLSVLLYAVSLYSHNVHAHLCYRIYETHTHSSILAWEIPWTEEPAGLVHGVAKESDMT